MPVSIDDTFREAAEKGEWRKAFICTEMLVEGEAGFIVCPPPKQSYMYESYKYNLDVLLRYPNNDSLYVMIVEALKKHVENYETFYFLEP